MLKTNKYTVSAFTLLELIIAICIGVIIISMAYDLLLILKQEWAKTKSNQEQMISLVLLKEVLERDIDNAIYIRTDDEKNFYFISNTDTIDYHLDTTIVRIQQKVADTFLIKISNIKPIYVTTLQDSGIVNTLMFNINKPLYIKNVVFKKYYTAADLLSFNLK